VSAKKVEALITPKIALLEDKRDKQLPALKKNIQKLKKEQLVLKEKRQKEKEAIYQKLDQAKSEYNHYKKKNELDEWLVKDPLSSKGLKAYIFESMLQDLNNSLSEYRQFIDFSIKVYVELESARKDIKIAIIKKKEEIPYEDLSKGQKQLTDAILAFAINDTITKNKPINIFLMDEVFESLSIDNVEIISNIVMKKASKYSIHMITHLTSFQPRGIKKTILQLNNQGHTVKAA
jgi:DNA repair exonuclease SbcCD ATPase subunit